MADDSPVNLDSFVHGAASEIIGGGMVVRSVIVFEYIDQGGALKNGLIHHHSISNDDAIKVVLTTAKHFLDDYDDE